MKNQYIKPRMVVSQDFMEQVIAGGESGCMTCCPYGRDKYSLSLCPNSPRCRQSHTVIDGKVMASSCPKFGNGYVVA